jgi:cysteine desulfurase
MMKLPVYMDSQATTPVDPRVLDAMMPYFTEHYGNAASRQHKFGWIAEEAVEASRKTIAALIGAESREIVFTAGATESNNLAIKGAADALRQKGNHIVTVQTEHKSVLDACKRLEKTGYQVTYLPVDKYGLINPSDFEKAITQKTILASVMIANNEIGTLQPVAEIGSICTDRKIFFHTDATQAVGKVPVDVKSMNIDMMSFSGHKLYGPKGVGALYVRSSNPHVKLTPLMDGGGHERGIRSGTLNVPGIVGLAKAVELSVLLMSEETSRLSAMRDTMYESFRREIGNVILNGHPIQRLPHNLNVSFTGVEDNVLMMSLKDVAVSTGSACSSIDPHPSHVLKALHVPPQQLHSAIRFGLGRFTTDEEIHYVVNRVVESVKKLRSQTHRNSIKQEIITS